MILAPFVQEAKRTFRADFCGFVNDFASRLESVSVKAPLAQEV